MYRSCAPHFQFLENFSFQPCLAKISALKTQTFPNFHSQDPLFFKENPLPRPYFWKPVWHIPTKIKVSASPPPLDALSLVQSWAFLHKFSTYAIQEVLGQISILCHIISWSAVSLATYHSHILMTFYFYEVLLFFNTFFVHLSEVSWKI